MVSGRTPANAGAKEAATAAASRLLRSFISSPYERWVCWESGKLCLFFMQVKKVAKKVGSTVFVQFETFDYIFLVVELARLATKWRTIGVICREVTTK
jgi:hypothetical protein